MRHRQAHGSRQRAGVDERLLVAANIEARRSQAEAELARPEPPTLERVALVAVIALDDLRWSTEMLRTLIPGWAQLIDAAMATRLTVKDDSDWHPPLQ